MSGMEEAYLILCVAAGVIFAVTLAWASWQNG